MELVGLRWIPLADRQGLDNALVAVGCAVVTGRELAVKGKHFPRTSPQRRIQNRSLESDLSHGGKGLTPVVALHPIWQIRRMVRVVGGSGAAVETAKWQRGAARRTRQPGRLPGWPLNWFS